MSGPIPPASGYNFRENFLLKKIFREEFKWFLRVREEALLREAAIRLPRTPRFEEAFQREAASRFPRTPEQALLRAKKEALLREDFSSLKMLKLRYKVLQGILLSLLGHSWRRLENVCVFVSFATDDEITLSAAIDSPRTTVLAGSSFKDIIAGRSLKELDALYLLLHYRTIFPKIVRKLLISVLITWLQRNVPYLMKNIYFVKQDYSGKTSILVTISKFIPLKVIGIQHGLLQHNYLSSTKIYPCYRTKIEAVYDDYYAQYIRRIKSAGSIVYALGPPMNCGTRPDSRECSRTLVFVGSGDLHDTERRQTIRRLSELSSAAGYNFVIRPHPLEKKLAELDGLPSNFEPKHELFDRDVTKVIFIGFYSTLLYEAGNRGFRTVWITPDLTSQPEVKFPEVSSLPNAYFCCNSELSNEWFSTLSNEPLYFVKPNPLYPRVAEMISELFPKFCTGGVVD